MTNPKSATQILIVKPANTEEGRRRRHRQTQYYQNRLPAARRKGSDGDNKGDGDTGKHRESTLEQRRRQWPQSFHTTVRELPTTATQLPRTATELPTTAT
ncbi:hypothetical protein AAHE18_10G079700 [Arachis hypogaea]